MPTKQKRARRAKSADKPGDSLTTPEEEEAPEEEGQMKQYLTSVGVAREAERREQKGVKPKLSRLQNQVQKKVEKKWESPDFRAKVYQLENDRVHKLYEMICT